MAGSSQQRVKICLVLCLVGIVSASEYSTSSSSTSSGISSNYLLNPLFYAFKCPQALDIIKKQVTNAVLNDLRMGASLLRLHFHDCFVQVSLFLIFFIYISQPACERCNMFDK